MLKDGYSGRILHVNLADAMIEEHPLSDLRRRMYLGGRGLGVAIAAELIDPGVDALGPDNVLVVAPGPCTGSGIPLGSRYDVVSVSPLTGTLGSANSGGFFGTEIKRAGFDAVVVTGRASAPVYLLIREDGAELRDASLIWGKTTRDTTEALKGLPGGQGFRVACIGPAGERLSRMACIINDGGRAAGRGGMGAVMGSKNLKALAVRGGQKMVFSNPARVEEVKSAIRKKLKDGGMTTGGLAKHGTASILKTVVKKAILPTRNFQRGTFEGWEPLAGERMTETILVRRNPCYSCMVGCGRITQVNGEVGEGPEYETIWAFGPDCGVNDLSWVARINYLCNDLGLDTISTGSTVACAMELSEKGHISEDIRFGDAEQVYALVRSIGYREGIGDALAEGSYRFAAMHGHPEFSMSAKKQELPAYDPRGMQGLGLNYATSVRGGCHVYGNMGYPELIGSPERLDPYATEGKAEWTKRFQDLGAAISALGICLFTERVLWAGDYAAIASAVTGFDIDEEEMFRIGERIWNLQRMFNLKAGIGSEEDALPHRFTDEPLTGGPPSGQVWRGSEMLPDYYRVRGWDEDGVPRRDTLQKLGIYGYFS
jgi:aldehyde:ferredoxin oxidoreductase